MSKQQQSYLSDVGFNDLVILLEYLCVNQFILLSGLEVHAVLVAECLLHVFESLIKENVLEDSDDVIEFIILFVLTCNRINVSVRNASNTYPRWQIRIPRHPPYPRLKTVKVRS